MYIYLIIITLLILFSLIEGINIKKNIKSFFQKVGVCIIFIIIGLNRWSYDYSNYIDRYINYLKLKEKGFILLVKILNNYSPYQGHEAIIFIVGLLMSILLIKISKNINLNFILLLYFIYPLILDINQTKNLYMYIFFYFGIISLVNRKTIYYIIFNIIGIFFHRVGILYFPIYFLKNISQKIIYKILFLGFICNFILLDLGIKYAKIFYGDKIYIYIRIQKSLTPIFYLIMIFLDFLLIYYCNKKYKKIYIDDELNIYKIILIFPIIYIPFFFYIGNLGRIYRNLFLVKYLFYSKLIKKVNKKDKIFIILYAISISIINLILYLSLMDEFKIFKLFQENKFIYYFI